MEKKRTISNPSEVINTAPAAETTVQQEPFNAKKYIIDKTFDSIKTGTRQFEQHHPGTGKNVLGGTLLGTAFVAAWAGICVLRS